MAARPDTPPPRRDVLNRNRIATVIAALIGLWAAQTVFIPMLPRAVEIPYSEFKSKLASGEISEVTLGTPIEGTMKKPDDKSASATAPFTTQPPPDGDDDLIKELGAAGVTYRARTPPSPITAFLLSWVLPIAVMMGLWSMVGRSASARMTGGMFGVGKSKATEVKPEQVGVTFKDVGGADEAIAELREIIGRHHRPGQGLVQQRRPRDPDAGRPETRRTADRDCRLIKE